MRRAPTLVLGFGLSACLVEVDSGSDGEVPPRVQAAFDDNCVRQGCHNAASAKNGLSLEAGDSDAIIGGDALGSDLPLVQLGSIDGSYIAQKILDGDDIVGSSMPPTGGDPIDMAVIVGWISGLDLSEAPLCLVAEGCACVQGLCVQGLKCEAGVCVPGECIPGAQGCPCNDDLCLDGLKCNAEAVCEPIGPPTGPELSFAADVWPILESNCFCHQDPDDDDGSGPLELPSAKIAYDNLVGVPAAYDDTIEYIKPNNLADSYVWLAVSHVASGGSIRMPANLAAEDQGLRGNDIAVIRQWILAGAPP